MARLWVELSNRVTQLFTELLLTRGGWSDETWHGVIGDAGGGFTPLASLKLSCVAERRGVEPSSCSSFWPTAHEACITGND